MANTIIHKKSSVPGKVPLVGDLSSGEIAINTNDGIVYTKKDDSTIISVGGAGEQKFVATGAIASGEVVGLNSDGTVSILSEIPIDIVGETNFHTGSLNYMDSVYDPDQQKIVIAYSDSINSGYGTTIVGTVSGSNITFGSEVIFSGNTSYISCTYDSVQQKIVIAYRDTSVNPDVGTAIVGTVSGTSISFGSPVVFHASSAWYISCAYEPVQQKIVIVYRDNDINNNDYGTAIVGTVSGTSISFGSPVVFYANTTNSPKISYDSSKGKMVIVFTNSGYLRVIVGTVVGTTISFGTVYTNSGGNDMQYVSLAFDPDSEQTIIAYFNYQYGNGEIILCSVSGDTPILGPKNIFDDTPSISYNSVRYDPIKQLIIVAFTDSNSYGALIEGKVDGSIVTFKLKNIFRSSSTYYSNLIYDSVNTNLVLSYYSNNIGKSSVVTPSSEVTPLLTFIGLSTQTVSDGDKINVTVPGGINDQQTGLTTQARYYSDYAGNITDNPKLDLESVLLGTAISSTEILVQK